MKDKETKNGICKHCGNPGDSKNCLFNPKNKDCACCKYFDDCAYKKATYPDRWEILVEQAIENHDTAIRDRKMMPCHNPKGFGDYFSFIVGDSDKYCPHCSRYFPENLNYLAIIFHVRYCYRKYFKKSCIDCSYAINNQKFETICKNEFKKCPINSVNFKIANFFVAECPYYRAIGWRK